MLDLEKKITFSLKNIEKWGKWMAESKNAHSGPMRSTIPPDFDIFDITIGFPTSKNVFWYQLR